MSFIAANKVDTSTNKPQSFESRQNSLFLPGVDAPHVYVRAWALGCFHSLISTQTFPEGADRVAGQLRGDKECPFSGVTKYGRVWRKVPESDARSVTSSLTFRHLPPHTVIEGALCISAQLSTDAVSALRKVTVEAT